MRGIASGLSIRLRFVECILLADAYCSFSLTFRSKFYIQIKLRAAAALSALQINNLPVSVKAKKPPYIALLWDGLLLLTSPWPLHVSVTLCPTAA